MKTIDVELRPLKTTGGNKVWPASERLLAHLLRLGGPKKRLLELGAGTGWLGLSLAAAQDPHEVTMTEQRAEEAQSLLKDNLEKNRPLIGSRCQTAILDFFDPDPLMHLPRDDGFDMIIGADLVYTREIVVAFCQTVAKALRQYRCCMLYAHTFRRFDHLDNLMIECMETNCVQMVKVCPETGTETAVVPVDESGESFEDFELFPEQRIEVLKLTLKE